MSSYVYTLNSLNDEIKRLNAHLKNLREQKRETQRLLKAYMDSQGIVEVDGIKAVNLTTRQRRPRKKKAEKEIDALRLFQETGIPNPKEFYIRFQETQGLTVTRKM